MQTWALSLPLRFPLRLRPAAWSRVAAPGRRQVSLAPGQVMCLRLSGQLCAGTTGALLDAVAARIGAAMPPVAAVVLDLSDTPAIDDDARAALLSLHGLLAQSQARLRLVLPEAATRAALGGDDAASTAGLDALYTTVRAALLAAYAALPGPAMVTPVLRALLMDPPELVLLPPSPQARPDLPPGAHPLSASVFPLIPELEAFARGICGRHMVRALMPSRRMGMMVSARIPADVAGLSR